MASVVTGTVLLVGLFSAGIVKVVQTKTDVAIMFVIQEQCYQQPVVNVTRLKQFADRQVQMINSSMKSDFLPETGELLCSILYTSVFNYCHFAIP